MKRLNFRIAAPRKGGDALSSAENDAERFASFDAAGLSEQDERSRRFNLARRMRGARTVFAGAFALAFAAVALLGFKFIAAYAAAFRLLSDRGDIERLNALVRDLRLDGLPIAQLRNLIENHRTILLVVAIVMLALTVLAAAVSAGIFTRLYRGAGVALRALYGHPGVTRFVVFIAFLLVIALPYGVIFVWTGEAEAPGLNALLGYAVAIAAALAVALRAGRLAARPAYVPPEILPDVGAPDRKPRAAVCARDPLARAAFERLLANNGFVIVFSSEYADETRTFFRRKGRGVDVLLLNDDVDDMAPLKFITHLADEAESAVGLVRLSAASDASTRRRSDEPHGRVVAVEHVQTPTTRAPLVEAAGRAAEAARSARAAATPLSEARNESGAVA